MLGTSFEPWCLTFFGFKFSGLLVYSITYFHCACEAKLTGNILADRECARNMPLFNAPIHGEQLTNSHKLIN
jgi:hypothetical protein